MVHRDPSPPVRGVRRARRFADAVALAAALATTAAVSSLAPGQAWAQG
jgi:hypothetical protein